MSCVYIVRNYINNKVYIGKTTKTLQKRWIAHKTDSKLYASNPMYQDMIKHGFDKFYAEILIEGNFTAEQLSNLEKSYILRYSSVTPRGYNQSTGGDQGFVWSREYKENRKKIPITWGDKISSTMTQKWKDPEYRKRMSDAHKGKRGKRKPFVTSLSRLDLPKEEIIADYKSGMKIAQIAKKHNTYHGGIKLRLQRWLPEDFQ